MIIVSKGAGMLVPAIVVLVLLAVVYAVDAIMQDSKYCSIHDWPVIMALIIAAGMVWFAGRRLNKAVPIKDAAGLDKKIKNHNTHSLYFLDFEYWAFVILALAACVYLF